MRNKLPELPRPAGYADRVSRRIKDAAARTPGMRLRNLAATSGGSVTELFLYDYIDPFADEYWGGISAAMVIEALAGVQTDTIRVRINSPGGDVFDGIAIMNALMSQNARVTVVVDSLCASIATAIAMAGETITMSPGSQMMIHPASGVCVGEAVDLRKFAEILDAQTANIAGLYASRAGTNPAAWVALMETEMWYSADEAVSAGLADSVAVVKQATARGAPEPIPNFYEAFWDTRVYELAGT